MRFNLLLLLSLSAAAWACNPVQQPEEPPLHLTADYYIRYLETERQLKVEAIFFEGDSLRTPQPKNMNGGVAFQGAAMDKRPLPGYGVRYSIIRTAEFNPPFNFTYQDDNGARQEQTIPMFPVTGFSMNGAISRARGATLTVQGPPLSNEEALVLLFSDSDNKAYSITLQGPSSDNNFLLSPTQLADLPLGTAQLYLVRKMRSVEKTTTRTTVAAMEYYTHTITVEIVE